MKDSHMISDKHRQLLWDVLCDISQITSKALEQKDAFDQELAGKWKAEPPTKPGWYWHFNKRSGDLFPNPLRVTAYTDGTTFVTGAQLGLADDALCANFPPGRWRELEVPDKPKVTL